MKQIIRVFMTVMMLVCISLACLGSVKAATDPIIIMKNGIFDDYPDAVFGKAADAYFKNGMWATATDKGITYVTYTGTFKLDRKDATAVFTFKVDTARATFTYISVKYNGEIQSTLEAKLMLYEVMESYTKDTKTNEGKAVSIVKTGEYDGYDNIPYGFIVQNFLTDVKWEGFQADDNNYYVDVTGGLIYSKKEAKLLMQYAVDLKTGEFWLNVIEINGNNMSDTVYDEIQEAMLDELEADY